MQSTDAEDLALIRAYLQALEAGEAGASLSRFFSEDVQQIELPNRLNPNGQTSDLSSILKRSEQGLKVLRSQRYEIVSELASDNHVAIEARWTGILAISLPGLEAGSEMKAHFAGFFHVLDGRILRQRNYDCFEPW